MTPLRQRMIEDMQLRNFATTPNAATSIMWPTCQALQPQPSRAGPGGRSPVTNCICAGTQALARKHQTPSFPPCNSSTRSPWKCPGTKRDSPAPAWSRNYPVVLAPDEVQRFLDQVTGVKHRAVLLTCYGSGLRISEAVSLKLSDIDSRRMLIRVEHGKGGKDRYTLLSPCLLEMLRAYCRILRPAGPWAVSLLEASPSFDCRSGANRLPRSLAAQRPAQARHPAHAPSQLCTHLLERGVDTRVIQALLATARIDTTARMSPSRRPPSAPRQSFGSTAQTLPA